MTLSVCSRALAIATAAIAVLILASPEASRAADPGVVEVKGTVFDEVEVNLEDDLSPPKVLVPGQDGKTGWPLREILLYVQAKTGKFDITAFDEDVVVSRDKERGDLSVNRRKVAQSSNDRKLPIYFLDDEGQTAMWDSGGVTIYTGLNPQIIVPKSTVTLKVDVDPPGPLTLKAGQEKKFTAKVTNPTSATVTLSWSVNGDPKQTGTSVSAGQFEFEFRDEGRFQISVFASAKGAVPNNAVVNVTVGKAKKVKKPKKEKKAEETSTGYDPGYTDDYYGYDYGTGTGTGTGNGAPSTGSPAPSTPEPNEQPEPPVDESGETVTGELIDPTQIASVVPPADESATGGTTEKATEADGGSDGGAMSTGVKTALGIGALLGLGGLAEAGAFSGALRRFRFRL